MNFANFLKMVIPIMDIFSKNIKIICRVYSLKMTIKADHWKLPLIGILPNMISRDKKIRELSRVQSLTNMMASLCHAIIVFLHGFFKSGWYWMIPDKSRSFRIKSHLGKNWTRQELKTCKFYYGFWQDRF